MWFTGVDQNGYYNGVGHATSSDGVEWTMDQANPVLTTGADGEWDDGWVIGGATFFDGTEFHMWYSGHHDGPEHLGYATSDDGTVWEKHPGNPVMYGGAPGSWDDTYLGPSSVVVSDDKYELWYWCSDGATGRICYADSTDGIGWTKQSDPVFGPSDLHGGWDSVQVYTPYVITDDTGYHMWFGGDDGDTYTVGYAYSSDGTEWVHHRWNPVFDADGGGHPTIILVDSTYHMWYSFDQGGWKISYATSESGPVVPAMDKMLIIPAAAVASGADGAFYQTDVDVSNADSVAIDYEFWWLPRGEINAEPSKTETFSLGAGKSVRYANVLAEVFGLEPNSLGALAILSTSLDLLAMSRTYNLGTEKTGGTYGQSMPAMSLGSFIKHGETRRILFGSENADMRTNIGCQNGTHRTTVVHLDLFKADGTPLGRETLMLKPIGNDQVNRIFEGHNPVNGYVDVSVALAGNLVYCYGSVLDNVTSDPTTIPPQ